MRPEAKGLVCRMLVQNSETRPEAVELLNDPWLNICRSSCQQATLNPKILTNLKSFYEASLFKKALLLYLVKNHELSGQKNALLDSFKAMDKNHDGQLTREELIETFQKADSRTIKG